MSWTAIPTSLQKSCALLPNRLLPIFLRSNPSHFSRRGGGAKKVKDIFDADLKLFPVECVSWKDIQKFLKRLNEREDNRGWLYRLPTEAEWEYACRGGATSQEECAFDFYFDQPTNDLSSHLANIDGEYPAGNAPKGPHLNRTTKVGSYPPNRLGIYDMHGNVWEWCADLFEAGGSSRVVRGGCWRGGSPGYERVLSSLPRGDPRRLGPWQLGGRPGLPPRRSPVRGVG